MTNYEKIMSEIINWMVAKDKFTTEELNNMLENNFTGEAKETAFRVMEDIRARRLFTRQSDGTLSL